MARYIVGPVILAIVLFLAYDHWTEPPLTLFEKMLSDTLAGKRLEDTIPTYESRGYPRAKIEQTIAEVRLFNRRVMDAPRDEVENIIVVRLAAERGKRKKEAEEFPNVYHGGLFWRRLGTK